MYVYKSTVGSAHKYTSTGADPGFQGRGGALKKIAPSKGRHEHFWGISCEKSRFYAKKLYFFPILGGGSAPPWIRPCNGLDPETSLQLFKTYVRPILLYGMKILLPTKTQGSDL